jgi:hypothetical protein
MKMDIPTIQIRDLSLAATLVSCGFEVRETTRDTSGRVHFVFTQSDELDRAVNSYWSDTLNVKARKFSDNIKMLKSRIYGER